MPEEKDKYREPIEESEQGLADGGERVQPELPPKPEAVAKTEAPQTQLKKEEKKVQSEVPAAEAPTEPLKEKPKPVPEKQDDVIAGF